jgi:peptide-methionine (S)-S-oxide reductase
MVVSRSRMTCYCTSTTSKIRYDTILWLLVLASIGLRHSVLEEEGVYRHYITQRSDSNTVMTRSLSIGLLFVMLGACQAFITPVRAAAARTTSAATTSKRFMISNLLGMLGGPDKSELIAPDKALKGRSQKMPNIDGLRHYVLGNKLEEVPEGHEVAVFGNGCFWGSEKGIWRFPNEGGIHSTAVGYCGGFTPNPTYEEACSGQTGHTEGVRVVYDPTKVSFVDILRWFWEAHDPTSGMGQGNDRGSQYRSGFYYFNDEQKALIEASKVAYEKQLEASTGKARAITTEIAAASDYEKYGGLWYFAEAYHQQYLSKPGSRPYCSAKPQGVSLPDYDEWCPFEKDSDLKKKHEPTLPASFWSKHAPRAGCSVVNEPNEVIDKSSY